MSRVARVAVIVLGVACGVLAAAWNDAGSGDLSGSVILLGAVALALILIGAMATSPTTRSREPATAGDGDERPLSPAELDLFRRRRLFRHGLRHQPAHRRPVARSDQ